MKKAAHEIEVLQEFLKVLDKTKYNSAIIESKKPPEPDLLVNYSNTEEYFELARLLDKNIMKLRILAFKIAPNFVKVNPSKIGLPERDILKSKLDKSYITNSKPLNLLLYYDRGPFFGGPPPVNIVLFFLNEIEPLIQADRKFANIYYYDRNSKSIVWGEINLKEYFAKKKTKKAKAKHRRYV
jgi:hypothetical protein